MKESRWGLRYAGIFILSAATLMLQVAYTRIFSIALWHHFVWMIVSIALLGYAASGTLLSVFPRLLRIELDRIQRFMLLLGHPVYSVSVVLFSLLLASGLGSYASGRLEPGGGRHKLVLLTVGLLTISYGFISPIISPLLGLPVTARLLATAVIVAPLGFLMGMPFPLGVRIMTGSKKPLITWAWAANGCASVLGSILPTILALYLGFSKIFMIAGALYLASLWMVIIHTDKAPATGI